MIGSDECYATGCCPAAGACWRRGPGERGGPLRRLGRPANFIIGKGQDAIYDHDPKEGLAEDLQKIRATRKSRLDLPERPDLGELVSGHVQPPPHGGLTCFVNVMGLGLQFAALGALAYEAAKKQGVGREIPTDWLLELEHP